MNLVGPGPLDFHYRDAERALSGLQPTGQWADFGSGAGFPGIPFAHWFPHLSVHLVDSRKKRCWFLQHVLDEADLSAFDTPPEVICSRIEQLSGRLYNGILARALAPPEVTLTLASTHLIPGGTAVLLLNQDQAFEAPTGFHQIDRKTYTIDNKPRCTTVFQWRPSS